MWIHHSFFNKNVFEDIWKHIQSNKYYLKEQSTFIWKFQEQYKYAHTNNKHDQPNIK